MKNLKLAYKMLILAAILMGSVLAVALVAVNQLTALNSQIRQLVDRTIVKRDALADSTPSSLRAFAQKNAILAPDDERSKQYADESRSLFADVRAGLDRLKNMAAADRVEGQAAAVEALGKALDGFAKVNAESLDLAVQNTNLKARVLLKGDHQRQVNIVSALPAQMGPGHRVEAERRAADVARLKTLDEIHAALLGMYPVLTRHIDSSSKEEKTAEEKKLTELVDQVQAGLSAARRATRRARLRVARRWPRSARCRRVSSSSPRSTPPTAPPRSRSSRRRPRPTSA